MRTAIILAGGFGTRLKEVVSDVPKPMALVNAQPFLNYLIKYLKFYGLKKIIFSTGHLSEKIKNYYGQEFDGMEIAYSHEEKPLGTGGGIRLAMEKCKEEEVLVLNGDSFFDADLVALYGLFKKKNAGSVLALRKVEDADRYGAIEKNKEGKIISFREKSEAEKPGLINAGVYILNTEYFLGNTPAGKPFSIEKDYFAKCSKHNNIFGQEFQGYFIDIGIPEDYQRAQHEFREFKYR
jgi:D-glycero-alpha-D-manno-heptose 1-phosphate guanylyltransferase